MKGGTPDRVPVQLGILSIAPIFAKSNFWDIYLNNKFDLQKLMVEMVRTFAMDGYLYTRIGAQIKDNPVSCRSEVTSRDSDFVVKKTVWTTPEGDLWSERTFPRNEVPTTTRGMIKNEEDFKLYLQYMLPDPEKHIWDTEPIDRAKMMLGEDGAVAATVPSLPGLHSLINIFDGKLQQATFFVMDHPELIEEYRRKQEAILLATLERCLEAEPDYVEISASGMLTLSNPELVRQLCLPTLKKALALCSQAGIPSELHCCGKEMKVMEMCAEETELDSINPLQPPPMGDCDLAECKKRFGKRFCLKGNVGVTKPMFLGKPDDVEKDVIRCLEAAKEGGGYILFTEEGLGSNTPFENIRRFVEVGKRRGQYL